MTHYIKDGNRFSQTPAGALDIRTKLPTGTYVVCQRPNGEYFLTVTDDFINPSRTYGDHERNVDRIINTFQDRPGGTGVLLVGEKGSGKSMLARGLSIRARAMDMPTLIVNHDFSGDGFNQFIQNIDQPAVIVFDEFEKVYNSGDQERILSLLDGTVNSKKLYVFTANNQWRVDDHMRNRPGRIYYMLEFSGLDESFIREYCLENLKDQTQTERVVGISSIFPAFNFDQLKAVIEEMNRYNEPLDQAIKMLNVKPEMVREDSTYEVTVIDLNTGDTGRVDDRVTGDPFTERMGISYTFGEGDDSDDGYARLTPGDIIRFDAGTRTFVYHWEGKEFRLRRVNEGRFNYMNAL